MQAEGRLAAVGERENPIAAYNHGELSITSRRLRYMGRGLRRHTTASIRPQDITALGVNRMWIRPRLLILPAMAVLTGWIISLVFNQIEPLATGALIAALLLPLPLLDPRHYVFVATQGYVLRVYLPGRRAASALAFLEEVDAWRETSNGQPTEAAVVTPTTRPYG